MKFTKGHGTGNDFVIVDASVELSPARVQALCHRRFGIGGDGVLRVAPARRPGAAFFMDYWNSDGSLAEMCGNGLRVFARYLFANDLATSPVVIDTRAGLRTAYLDGELIRVDMGPAEVQGKSTAVLDGRGYRGLVVSVGNPHLVCAVAQDELAGLDLTRPPGFDPELFPHGVNVEFSAVLGRSARMRVFERGSGETMSCGTGAVAAGVAALHAQGRQTGTVEVTLPGGQLTVHVDESTSWLTGPAALVASGTYLA